jgi:subfamily B ATP-binding cassette protein MsbA
LAPPLFTKYLVDYVLLASRYDLLDNLFFILIGVFLIDLMLGFGNHYIMVRINQLITYDVRTHFFEHLQKLSMKFYDNQRSGDLIYRLFGDTAAIPGVIGTIIVDLFLYIVTLLVVSILLLIINTKLALFCFLIFPLHILAIIGFRKPIKKYSLRLRQKDENISGDVVEFFSSVRMVKAFSCEQLENERFANGQSDRFNLALKSTLINKVSSLVVGSINNFLFFLVLWYGGHEVIGAKLSLGDLMALLILVGRLYVPVSGITNIVLGLQDASVGIRRVYEILDIVPNTDSGSTGRAKTSENINLDDLRWSVEFRDIVFSYNGGTPILKHINFSVPSGTNVAIVGHSGVGKTTLMNLLTGFYHPQQGNIFIDGHDLRSLPKKELRMQMGIVLQDPYLISGSIKDNILYGKPIADHSEVVEAAVRSNAHPFIVKLPDQYDTKIGERGIRLSGGEKQRIAIARAFLRNPKMLIMDEGLSAVDLASELAIQEALERLMAERTCFTIAHRLSTIRNSDKIAVLNNGTIMEVGDHWQLMEKRGVYYHLYERMATI